MVLLLTRRDDGSSAFVVQWLLYLNKSFKRLNGDTDAVKIVSVDFINDQFILREAGKNFNLFDFSSVWYRRRGLSIKNTSVDRELLQNSLFPGNDEFHKKHLDAEVKELIEFAHHIVEKNSDKKIGSHKTSRVNKFKVLDIARDSGLMVPKTFVVNSKKHLEELLKEEKNIITKAMSQGIYFFTEKRHYYSYTEKITQKELDRLPDTFFPSLIQLEILKKYELRIFYLHGVFYPMAIFSQNSDRTKVDFRKDTGENKVRYVPAVLPDHIESGLKRVAEELSLDTGSFDMIVDEHNNYIFLEVNPIGQFSMTSFPCNYYLERKIAELL